MSLNPLPGKLQNGKRHVKWHILRKDLIKGALQQSEHPAQRVLVDKLHIGRRLAGMAHHTAIGNGQLHARRKAVRRVLRGGLRCTAFLEHAIAADHTGIEAGSETGNGKRLRKKRHPPPGGFYDKKLLL